MALGFGFNKVKVLAQAEKFVQQGKLPNAISEYEKIIKEDPKDLTVLNTIGDLYARVGNNDQAIYYFKKVGDQYAQNGFAVKAIAIYKKLTKIGPYNSEHTTKLAELYGQQGLFNDARVHYMQVADHLLKSGDNQQAARVFQKILELDPENAHTQAKLADLYTKLGKKDEARNIFYSAAETLYARGSYAAAEEAVEKVLTLDPANANALMLRGLIAVDSGDSHAAVNYLEQISDLDSRPDGLRALLRAKLQTGNADGVEAVAEKLLNRHKDGTGVTTLAQWYASNNQMESALRLYEAHAERLFGGNHAALQDALNPLAARARENPAALAILNRLMNQSGQPVDHAQNAEAIELQAHAAAQKGDFAQARDLYKQLTEMEPENALHAQSYRQMLAKLGEDSATRILTPEEAAQAFMVEELDETAPSVHQSYDPPTEKAIESALTDAELYVSYNVPSKAIPPLEAALPLAPQDVNLNQRLASLYARAERYGDAARMYQNLSKIYEELGHPSEAARYLEAAKKFALRAPAASAVPAAPPPAPAKPSWPPAPAQAQPVAPVEHESAPPATPEVAAESSVQEFTFDTADMVTTEPELGVSPPVIEPEPPSPVEINLEPVAFDAPPAPAAASTPFAASVASGPADASAEEIDISNEWEDMIEVEPAEPVHLAESVEPVESAVAEVEVQSYQEIPQEPVQPVAVQFEPAKAAEADLSPLIADKVQEIRFYITQQMWEPAKEAILDLTELAPDAPEVTELIAEVSAGQAKAKPAEATPAMMEESPAAFAAIETAEPAVIEPPPPPPPVIEKKPQPAVAMELENVLEIADEPKAKPPKPVRPQPAAAAKEKSTEDILGDFILDLEQTDLADFAPKAASSGHGEPAAAAAAATPAPASASLSDRRSVAPDVVLRSNGDMQDAESSNALSDILSELREETFEEAEPEEDPETHYNLGIAFKEMGLLDEAIGELQKVCHAVDRGAPFSQPIQALTWLAQCLVDKGAPEAAVRWYQKALQLPGLDNASRCSIYYDLASAYQASGDDKAALTNFMEVYGSNIDFRDVASRIKALKA
ncbi:MAG TPA: tetratricopeptide repeat protein [Candidatus Angelobacter sp.]|nr:tetratricopeptide repeat protein [Candidatus Angelobacter sp.]